MVNGYVTLVHRATHHDPVVYDAFLKVMNLMQPPTSLMHPKLIWRVLRNARRGDGTLDSRRGRVLGTLMHRAPVVGYRRQVRRQAPNRES